MTPVVAEMQVVPVAPDSRLAIRSEAALPGALIYLWLLSPDAICRLNSAERLRGTLRDVQLSCPRCLAKSTIWPTW